MPVATLSDIPLEEAVRYAGRDADCTLRTYNALVPLHRALGLEQVEQIDLGALPMFERMQATGMLIDKTHFSDFSTLLSLEMSTLQRDINILAGMEINPNSGDQIVDLLYPKLGISTTRMTKSGTRQSADEKALSKWKNQYPVIGKIVAYRERQKLKSTYADAIPLLAGEDGRVRGDFRSTVTPTGQLAIGSPNLLAMPAGFYGREIRRGFIAGDGNTLASFDLQGFHFRVMAHLSRDKNLCKLFTEGRDVHSETAAKMFGIPLGRVDKNKHRRPAKTVGLGIINGLTEMGLSIQFDLAAAEENDETLRHDPDECREFIDSWMEVNPGVRAYQQECITEARRTGMVRDQWGRIRYLPNIHSRLSGPRSEAERQSFSHKIQGTSHGILKKAMAAVWGWLLDFWQEWRGQKVFLQPELQVHDELIFENTDRSDVIETMQTVVPFLLCNTVTLRVPLESSGTFAGNWAELK